MADQFRTTDKSPIMDGGITFRSWRFGFREIVMGVIAVLLFVLVIILSGLLGNTTSELSDARTSAQRANNICRKNACLQTSAHLTGLLNVSIPPCTNFFQFACGGYKVKNPVDVYTVTQTILQQMAEENKDRLVSILEAPVDRYTSWSAERKLKHFYSSCLNDFEKEKLKGTPFLQKIVPMLGSWYVTDTTWQSGSWSFDRALKAVQTDLWVDALYAPRLRRDDLKARYPVITIYPGGSGRYMYWRDYTETPNEKQQKLQNDYKSFMRTLARMLARDAQVTDHDLSSRIEVFVGDAYAVEAKIAKFARNSKYQRTAFTAEERISLDELKQQTGGEIDWTSQMTQMFDDAGVTKDTKVVVPYPTYLTNLTAMIRSLDAPVRNRQLHNYLTWRVIEVYVQDLSFEYMHANRQLYVDKYGYQNFLGTQRYCFSLARQYLKEALGALYVMSNFEAKNKAKVTEITQSLRTALMNMVSTNSWMDKATKDYATEKLKGTTYKIGYPDFIIDETKVDAIYNEFAVNESDFFGNILAVNTLHKREWNREVREGEDRNDWYFSTYTTNMGVWFSWDEILLPAGILQFPIYNYDMPHYYSFGALGTHLGHFIHHLIDEEGRKYDKGGDKMKEDRGWWSNQTLTNYNKVRQCVANLYTNVTQGPYVTFNGDQVNVDVNGDEYAWDAMSITTGIRLAYNAYQAWQDKHGRDPFPPGLDYTPEQLFFVAHAQVECYNRDPVYDYFFTNYLNGYSGANEETRVNLALMELPEFKDAFGCQATDKMVSAKPCTYY